MQTIDRTLLKNWLLDTFPDLTFAYLFGSFASNTATPSSDIDIAIYTPSTLTPQQLFQHAQSLGIQLKREVDLVNIKAVSTVFQQQIISTGDVLICHDDTTREYFEMVVLSSYVRLNELRKNIINHFVNRGKNNG